MWPRAGDRAPTGDKAAGLRLARASADVDINLDDQPTWYAWRAEEDLVDFGDYYGRDINGIMMYAVVYLEVQDDLEARIALASADEIQVLLDGGEIFIMNDERASGGKGKVQNPVPLPKDTLEAGHHVLMVKVFDHCGPQHNFRLRFENPHTGAPLTEKDGIKVCLDPKECGFQR